MRAAAEAAETARGQVAPRNPSDEMDINAILAATDGIDRQILELRLRGVEWVGVQAATGLSAAACRQRWNRLVRRLKPPEPA